MLLENSRLRFIESVHENLGIVQEFSRPLAPALAVHVFCSQPEPNSPEGLVFETISTL